MRNRIALTLAMGLAIGSPAAAQTERFLNYDMGQTVEMSGTVQKLDWMNPNSELRVLVKNPNSGMSEEWTFVMGPPTRAEKFGWNKMTLKQGDQITLLMYPAQDKSHPRSGQLVSVTLPDGRKLQATGPNPPG